MNVGTESSVTPIAPSQVATTVQHLRRHFATGVTRDAAWRVRQLEALKRLLVERERDIVNAVKADLASTVRQGPLFGCRVAAEPAQQGHLRHQMQLGLDHRLREASQTFGRGAGLRGGLFRGSRTGR